MEHWWNDTDKGSVWSIVRIILTGGECGALVECLTGGKPQISHELKELIQDLRGEKQATNRQIQFVCNFCLNYVKRTQSVPHSKHSPSLL